MATYTADAAQSFAQPRANHGGPTIVESQYIANGVTISSGDVYQMVKIPNGATIYDIRFYGRSAGVAATIFSLGISGNATLFGPVTISSTDQYLLVGTTAGSSATAQFPYRVSLSDDTVSPWVTIQATVASTSSVTATGTFGIVVTYAMRGQAKSPP